MRDDDPTSLNDDFIRTFTISNTHSPAGDGVVVRGTKLEVTMRRHGPATGLLWRTQSPRAAGVAYSWLWWRGGLPNTLRTGPKQSGPVFVAGGVGITPLLAQAQGVLSSEPEGADKTPACMYFGAYELRTSPSR